MKKIVIAVISSLSFLSCKPKANIDLNSTNNVKSQSSSGKNLCAAIRGNGQRIFAHFGTMAALIEDVGLVKGVGGSSSGSITSFIYESMYINSELRECGDKKCEENEIRSRLSIMLKTIEAFLELGRESSQWQGLTFFAGQIEKLKSDKSQIASVEEWNKHISQSASSFDPQNLGLFNPEMKGFMLDSNSPLDYRKQQFKKQVEMFGKFSAESPDLLYRPGLVDFKVFGRLIGRIGSFYAGYSPMKTGKWTGFFNSCKNTKGKLWKHFSNECREQFKSMVREFYSKPEGPNRAMDPIGKHIPAIVASAAITAPAAVEKYFEARAAFRNPVSFKPILDSHSNRYSFNDLKFGHWHSNKDTKNLIAAQRKHSSSDLQWKKFASFGEVPWLIPLSLSPAEPGLTNGLEVNVGGARYISMGGWGNLFPVETLQSLDACDEVAFMTRRGNNSFFLRGIVGHLGVNKDTADKLYDLEKSNSSFKRNVEAADYIMCSDWDGVPLSSYDAFYNLMAEGYTTPIRAKKGRAQFHVGCF